MSEPHEAGRELDAEVAERVMGKKVAPGVWAPSFSTDIAAAWEVVESFLGKGESWPRWHGWFISIGRHPEGWACEIGTFVATAETAPLAICRAALLARAEIPIGALTPRTEQP